MVLYCNIVNKLRDCCMFLYCNIANKWRDCCMVQYSNIVYKGMFKYPVIAWWGGGRPPIDHR